MLTEKYLLEEYTPLVRKIANGFARKVPRSILREDLVAAGMCGLWDAIRRRAEASTTVGFEWYVRVRVRGAILDELRTQDWLPRRARRAADKGEADPIYLVHSEDMEEWEEHVLAVAPPPMEEILDEEYRRRVGFSFIDKLPKRERYIAVEYYFNGKPFTEIANSLGISAPRVSQLHSRLITRLQLLAKEAANDIGVTIRDSSKPVRRRRRRVPVCKTGTD